MDTSITWVEFVFVLQHCYSFTDEDTEALRGPKSQWVSKRVWYWGLGPGLKFQELSQPVYFENLSYWAFHTCGSLCPVTGSFHK